MAPRVRDPDISGMRDLTKRMEMLIGKIPETSKVVTGHAMNPDLTESS